MLAIIVMEARGLFFFAVAVYSFRLHVVPVTYGSFPVL